MSTPRLSALLVTGSLALGALVFAQAPPAQQSPVFRTGVEVVRLDVTVLDDDRRPVTGLTAVDFTVLEDGKVQPIVDVVQVHTGDRDPRPTAWMRYATRDVAMNDLADELGNGRLFTIMIDDWNLPDDDVEITLNARQIARYIVESLGPSDVAAVVFTGDTGRIQDFTPDRSKLFEAIDRYDPHPRPDVGRTPRATSGGGADMPYRYSPVLSWSECWRRQPAVPMISALVSRMAAVPDRRKTLLFISTGPPVNLDSGSGCLNDEVWEAFRHASRGNVNIQTIDPSGSGGYESYLETRTLAAGGGRRPEPAAALRAAKLRRDFLKALADNTGGRSVVRTDAIESAIDEIFEEAGSYYLLGYQPLNEKADGKFRKVEVKVKRSDVSVQTAGGYWAPREGTLASTQRRDPLMNNVDLGRAGLWEPTALALRASVVPIRLSAADPATRQVDVAVVLSVRLPAVRGTIAETTTIVRTIYDADGRASPPSSETRRLELDGENTGARGYDVLMRVALAPGRHQLRYNVRSAALDRAASVYADVDVPDFRTATLTMSPLVLGLRDGTASSTPRQGSLSDLLPVVPTTVRDFSIGDDVTAFVRVFQGGVGLPAPIVFRTQVFDKSDVAVFESTETRAVDPAHGGRAVSHDFDVPLDRFKPGPHLLSVSATLPGGRMTRRDVVFRVD